METIVDLTDIKVSVVMPTYNSAEFVAESIDAILAQTHCNWELLITDDCSTDNTREIVAGFAQRDSRVRLLTLEKNSGAGVARNNSIREATGDYIAFCDSDDVWKPEKLKIQLSYMRKHDVDVCYGSYLIQDEDGNITGVNICKRITTESVIKRDNTMGNLTVIYNAKKLGKVFFPTIRKRQDWALNIMLLKMCKVAHGIVDPIAYYRVRSGSISRNKKSLIKYNVQVYKEILKCNIVVAWLRLLFVFMPSHLYKLLRLKIINY